MNNIKFDIYDVIRKDITIDLYREVVAVTDWKYLNFNVNQRIDNIRLNVAENIYEKLNNSDKNLHKW